VLQRQRRFLWEIWRRIEADDATFLAGGVAFAVLLAGVPFVMLLAAGLGALLQQSPERIAPIVQGALADLFPSAGAGGGSILDPVLNEVARTSTVVGIGAALSFIWFSMRLFATLRAVTAFVFMHGKERSFVQGKLFDLVLLGVALVLLSAWVVVNGWLAVSTGRLGAALHGMGVLPQVTSGISYGVNRALSLAIVVGAFSALYRWIPARRIPWRPVIAGALAASALFELARAVFSYLTITHPPESLYTGTIGAVFTVIFWTYYAALVFIIGAEVAYVTEVRLIHDGILPMRPHLQVDRATTLELSLAGLMKRVTRAIVMPRDLPDEDEEPPR
jgi:membrane protein